MPEVVMCSVSRWVAVSVEQSLAGAQGLPLWQGTWLLYRKNYPAGQDFLTFQRDARNVEFCATYLKCQRQQLVYQKSNVKQNPLAVVSL